ncbi:10731_t:CDS:2, partial [Gigaspora rosea]
MDGNHQERNRWPIILCVSTDGPLCPNQNRAIGAASISNLGPNNGDLVGPREEKVKEEINQEIENG